VKTWAVSTGRFSFGVRTWAVSTGRFSFGVRTWAVSTGRFSLGVRTFNPVLTDNRDEIRRRFSGNGWEPPNTGNDPMQSFHLHFIQVTPEGVLWALNAPNDFLTLGCLDEQIS
jgi:hypothetical protein